MTWDDLRVFLAVYRSRSHARASAALGVDATTIGRRLSALEGELSTRLFDRTPAGLAPTRAGETLLPRAERVEAEILAAERELTGADERVTGPLRITSGDGLATYVLVPALVDLRRGHPDLEIELRSETRTLDLSRREADVAVRLARPKEPALVARRLGAMRFGLYASRAYLERRGAPRTAAELVEHDLVGFEAALDDLPQVRWLNRHVARPRWALRANTTTAQVVACASGLGVALLPTFVTTREKELVPVLPRLERPTREMYAVTHSDMRKNARVARALAWLAETLAPVGG